MLAIVIIGPPGSGKSTLAHAASQSLQLPHISSGDIAREIAQRDAFAKAGLNRGDWAPELAMRAEVQAQIEAASATDGGFVIDGFPRRLEQLYILESVPGIQPLYFILVCNTLTCIRRLIARGREGDHPDAVMVRIKAYEEYTEPVVGAVYSEACSLFAQQHTPEELLGTLRAHVDEWNENA